MHTQGNSGIRERDVGVSVAMEEITQQERSEKVYKPEILDKAATLYKKPG